MTKVSFDALLEAGVHFGHLKRKWHPNMAPYIFMERNGIHIIDLYKTVAKLEEAQKALKQMAMSGRRILFVATKKQAKEIVSELVKKVNMPYVTERWPGGMLTNFATIRKAVRKMSNIDKMANTDSYKALSKRERLQISREREKLEKNLGSIADMSRLPAALFVVDINKEKIAVAEARKLNIPIFGMVDTNSDPTLVDFAIPANDDASKSIAIIVNAAVMAIAEGLNERKAARDKQQAEEQKKEVQEIDIKSKSENLAAAEEEADKQAEKADKPEAAVKKKAESDAKAKRPRKRITKK